MIGSELFRRTFDVLLGAALGALVAGFVASVTLGREVADVRGEVRAGFAAASAEVRALRRDVDRLMRGTN